MMQSAKTSVFDDVSYRNIPNENKKTSGLGHAESAIGCLWLRLVSYNLISEN